MRKVYHKRATGCNSLFQLFHEGKTAAIRAAILQPGNPKPCERVTMSRAAWSPGSCYALRVNRKRKTGRGLRLLANATGEDLRNTRQPATTHANCARLNARRIVLTCKTGRESALIAHHCGKLTREAQRDGAQFRRFARYLNTGKPGALAFVANVAHCQQSKQTRTHNLCNPATRQPDNLSARIQTTRRRVVAHILRNERASETQTGNR